MIISNFHLLWNKLPTYRKRKFRSVLWVTALLTLFEAANLGALVPFLAAITNPDDILANPEMAPIFGLLNITNKTELATFATASFIVITIVTGILRMLLLRLQYQTSHQAANDLSYEILLNIIHQDYVEISKLNSSEVISALTQKMQQFINSTLLQLMILVSSSLVFVVLVTGLLIIDWKLTMGLSFVLIFCYASVFLIVRPKTSRNSMIMSVEYDRLVRVVQEALGGVREIILGSRQSLVMQRFDSADKRVRAAQASTLFLAGCPKMLIEVVIFASVAVVGYLVFQDAGTIALSIPTLGALAYAAQRLLPIMQQAYSASLSIRGSKDIVDDLRGLLEQGEEINRVSFAGSSSDSDDSLDSAQSLALTDKLTLKNVSFAYDHDSAPVLHNIDLEIRAGDRIGIFGKTGSGKSTLLDVIMGLLEVDSGEVILDGENKKKFTKDSWFSIFSHVPQSIFLADTTITNNICSGVVGKKFSLSDVFQAAELAQIKNEIDEFPEGFDTVVGERGVRLSGGQLQRLGIARAFYEKSSVLILDEATSAVDPKVEKAIEVALGTLDREITVLKVAHRMATLETCDMLYEIADGKIVRSGTYKELF